MAAPRPDIEFARLAIDGALQTLATDGVEWELEGSKIAERAIAIDNKPGTWGRAFDALVLEKSSLDTAAKERLLADMEARLARVSDIDKADPFDPFGAEAAALRLASFYRRESRLDDVRRVLLKFRDAFVAAARLASGMVAYAWIERVHAALHDQGVAREANALEPLLREHGKRSTTEMKGSGVSVTIPADDISESLMTSAPMIRALLSKATERLPLTLDLLMAQVRASPVFAEDRHAIIELGSLLFSEKISRFTFECCCPISVAGISGMTSVTDCSPRARSGQRCPDRVLHVFLLLGALRLAQPPQAGSADQRAEGIAQRCRPAASRMGINDRCRLLFTRRTTAGALPRRSSSETTRSFTGWIGNGSQARTPSPWKRNDTRVALRQQPCYGAGEQRQARHAADRIASRQRPLQDQQQGERDHGGNVHHAGGEEHQHEQATRSHRGEAGRDRRGQPGRDRRGAPAAQEASALQRRELTESGHGQHRGGKGRSHQGHPVVEQAGLAERGLTRRRREAEGHPRQQVAAGEHRGLARREAEQRGQLRWDHRSRHHHCPHSEQRPEPGAVVQVRGHPE